MIRPWLATLVLLGMAQQAALAQSPPLSLEDVFALEYADDPRIASDGDRIAYVRKGMNRMTDRVEGSLWLIGAERITKSPLCPDLGLTRSVRHVTAPRKR
jgi:hypothetical protein